jgi:hypothetical protein
MYNAAKAIRISTIVASLRLQPAKHIAAKKFPNTIIHNRSIGLAFFKQF